MMRKKNLGNGSNRTRQEENDSKDTDEEDSIEYN